MLSTGKDAGNVNVTESHAIVPLSGAQKTDARTRTDVLPFPRCDDARQVQGQRFLSEH